MSYMIEKFKGKYNLSVPYDLETGEFVRNEDGTFANYHDIRIDCRGGSYICHQGGSLLKACFDTPKRKQLVLSKLPPEIQYEEPNWFDFTFNVKYVAQVAEAMGAKTSHKNRSPYSVHNLPKVKYEYNNLELCKKLSKIILNKYGLGNYNKILGEYIRKYKIPAKGNNKLKFLQILDKYNKIEKILKIEKESE